MDWLDEILNENAAPAPAPEKAEPKAAVKTVPAPRSGMPIHPNAWGSGGKATAIPGEKAPAAASADTTSEPASGVSANTPAEDSELRKRKETPKEVKPLPVVPPMPTKPPVIPAVSKGEEAPGVVESAQEETEEETTGRIRAALAKARQVTGSAKEKVSEKVGPAKEKVLDEVDPNRAKKWSLLWAAGTSWVVAPGTLAALYDRGVMMFGSWTEGFPRAEYLNSGGLPHEWDLLEGPAWWVKNTVGAAWEAGLTDELLIAALVGLVPTVSFMHLNHKIARFFTVIGVAYFIAFSWFPHWWEVYLATMVSSAYYGWTMANRFKSGFVACMMRVPLAALVSGTILYSPGAIF